MGATDDGSDRAGTGDGRKDFAEPLLEETRQELTRADGKAATLMSASGVVISVLLAGLIAGRWNSTVLQPWQWLWWIGVGIGIAGVVAFAAAVWPRVSHTEPKEALAFFGHVAQFKNVQALETALDRKPSSPTEARTVDQLLTVSKIVRMKYWLIRGGMVLLGIGLCACVVSIVLSRTC
jgi:MFS family permease